MNFLSSRAWETESEASLTYVIKKNNKMTASKSSVSYSPATDRLLYFVYFSLFFSQRSILSYICK